MADRSQALVVINLRETVKALRDMRGETPKEISKFHKEVARFVANEAQQRAQSRPRKERTGRTARGIKTSGTQRESKIRVTTPDAKVQEWGGRAPLFGNRNRWFQVRPKNNDGYFLYPAIRHTRPTVERIYLKGLDGAIRDYWNR